VNQATFRAIGEALFGTYYRTELAQALGCDQRTVRRYDDGIYPVPEDRQKQLLELLRARKAKLTDLIGRVK